MKVVTQHFFGTTAEWTAENPLLYNAVWGFEKTSDGKVLAKLGNGVDRWNALKYFDIENLKDHPELHQQISSSLAQLNQTTAGHTENINTMQNGINALNAENVQGHPALHQQISNSLAQLNQTTAGHTESISMMQNGINALNAENVQGHPALHQQINNSLAQLNQTTAGHAEEIKAVQEDISTLAAENVKGHPALHQQIDVTLDQLSRTSATHTEEIEMIWEDIATLAPGGMDSIAQKFVEVMQETDQKIGIEAQARAQSDAELAAAAAAHANNKSNPHGVTKSQIGLNNVTNDAQVKVNEKGAANGVATLNGSGKVPLDQMPEGGILYTVARNNTLQGDGTIASPLGIAGFLGNSPVNNTVNRNAVAAFQNSAIPMFTLAVGSGKLSDLFPDTFSAAASPVMLRVYLNTSDAAELRRAGLPDDSISAYWLIIRFGAGINEQALIAFGEDKQGTGAMYYKNIQEAGDIDFGGVYSAPGSDSRAWRRVSPGGVFSGFSPILGAAAATVLNVPAVFDTAGRLIPHASGALGSIAFQAAPNKSTPAANSATSIATEAQVWRLMSYSSTTETIDTTLANLQATINALPKYLRNPVTIRVSAGTITTNITVERFFGPGSLTINCVDSANAVISPDVRTHNVGRVIVQNNNCSHIIISGFTANTTDNIAFYSSYNGCSRVLFQFCNASAGANNTSANVGIQAANSSAITYAYQCTISNKAYAIASTETSLIRSSDNRGIGNAAVFRCSGGGSIIIASSGAITGTTMYSRSGGGILVLTDGTLWNSQSVKTRYTQYPVAGQSTLEGMFPENEAPAALYGGTWTERFVNEDVFFKIRPTTIESDRGKTYNTANQQWDGTGTVGIQEDAIRPIEGRAWGAAIGTSSGAFGGSGALYTQENSGSAAAAYNSNARGADVFLDTSRRVPTASRNRTRNRLIKVWEKTA